MDHQHNRLYSLRSHPYYGFHTGNLPSEQQLLVGRYYNAILAIFFDATGQMLQINEKIVINTTRIPLDFTPEEQRQFDDAITSYLAQLHFQEGPIHVWEFFTHGVGIDILPSHYQDFLDDPTRFPLEEHEYIRQDIERWLGRGNFVFYWGEDYYCNREGKVISS
jgi:hypothetical protein